VSRIDELLTERLRDADPLPHDELDRLLREGSVEELLSREPARGPARRSRRILWAVVSTACVAAVAGVLVMSLPAGRHVPAPANVGILGRPATDADRLPDWVREDQRVLEMRLDRDDARLARSTDTRRYYVVPADGGRQVCLVDIPVKEPPLPAARSGFTGPGLSNGGVQCAGTGVFTRRFMVVLTGYARSTRQIEVVAVAPDGFDRASSGDAVAEVRDNLAILRPSRLERTVRIAGPEGDRIAYQNSPWFPGPGPPSGPPTLDPSDLDPTVSVFNRPAGAADVPPRALKKALDAARRRPGGPDPEPGTERRVATTGRTSYWLVRDRFTGGGRRALLGLVAPWGATLRPISLPTRAEPLTTLATTAAFEPYGLARITLRTVVPDGFTTAIIGGRTFPVRNNFLLVRAVSVEVNYSVDLRGPAGRVVGSASLGGSETRFGIPSNEVVYGTEEVVSERARGAGLREPYAATIVAGLREDVVRVLGPWAETRAAPSSRTVQVVTVRSGDDALVLVTGSAAGSDLSVKQRRYRVGEVPDLSDLGRVRPLDLTP